jgi:large subunit ribosomal protein L7/L12
MLADPVSSWFQEQGIPPLWGGMLLGGALVYLLVRKWNPRPQTFEPPRVPEQLSMTVQRGDLRAQVLELVRQRKKIDAIKLVREREDLGLKEAKDVVDAWELEDKG